MQPARLGACRPDPLRRRRHVDAADAIGAPERIGNGVHHRRARPDGAGLAGAFHAQRMGPARHIAGLEKDRRHVGGARQRVIEETRGDQLTGEDWNRLARECGLGARQVLARVRALAQSAATEAGTAASEVSAMPAGGHLILNDVCASIERRARNLLAQLDEIEVQPTTAEPALADG